MMHDGRGGDTSAPGNLRHLQELRPPLGQQGLGRGQDIVPGIVRRPPLTFFLIEFFFGSGHYARSSVLEGATTIVGAPPFGKDRSTMGAAAASVMAPGQIDVIPRNLRFIEQMSDAATWFGGDPVATAVFNALSLSFPDGERLFIDAVLAHKSLLTGKLLEDAKNFVAQEAIHTREHVMLNKGLDETHYPLAKIREKMKKDNAMAREMGPMAMLLATICLEHFTALMGDYALSEGSPFEKAEPEVRRLWQWHALEETEHKAVAFDVFMEATKDWSPLRRYFERTRMMAFISVDFIRDIVNWSAMLLEADGMPKRQARRAVWRFLFGKGGFLRESLKDFWAWFRPGFHPWQHDNSALLDKWRAVFAAG